MEKISESKYVDLQRKVSGIIIVTTFDTREVSDISRYYNYNSFFRQFQSVGNDDLP